MIYSVYCDHCGEWESDGHCSEARTGFCSECGGVVTVSVNGEPLRSEPRIDASCAHCHAPMRKFWNGRSFEALCSVGGSEHSN